MLNFCHFLISFDFDPQQSLLMVFGLSLPKGTELNKKNHQLDKFFNDERRLLPLVQDHMLFLFLVGLFDWAR